MPGMTLGRPTPGNAVVVAEPGPPPTAGRPKGDVSAAHDRSIDAVEPSLRASESTTPLQSRLLASTGDEIATGLAANTLAPERYEMRSIDKPRSSSVAGIFDREKGPIDKTGARRGAFAVRFDTPGPGPGGVTLGNHLNFDTLPKNVRDPHVEVPASIVKGAAIVARGLEVARTLAAPVAATSDTLRIASALHADGNRIGPHTAKAAAGVAGGWTGAFIGSELGAESGAAAGGAIGLLFGGVGAVPGAAIGGLLGGIGGGIAGAHIGERAGEEILRENTR